MQISTLPMADGSQATYIKGSRHLVHDGVVYLNYDKKEHSPHIFTEDAIGKKTDNGLIKVRTAYSTVILKEAETMAIPVKDSATCATFVQGSMQILYGEDVANASNGNAPDGVLDHYVTPGNLSATDLSLVKALMVSVVVRSPSMVKISSKSSI